ncbi:MAG: hypothetical protein ACRD0W_24495 [Acidimicrobiales bacterium]
MSEHDPTMTPPRSAHRFTVEDDQWTAIPGTDLEVLQNTGRPAAVDVVAGFEPLEVSVLVSAGGWVRIREIGPA